MLWVALVITMLYRACQTVPGEVEPVPRMTTASGGLQQRGHPCPGAYARLSNGLGLTTPVAGELRSGDRPQLDKDQGSQSRSWSRFFEGSLGLGRG